MVSIYHQSTKSLDWVNHKNIVLPKKKQRSIDCYSLHLKLDVFFEFYMIIKKIINNVNFDGPLKKC